MFLNRPTAVIQGEADEDAEIYVAMWPDTFMQQINVDLKLMTGLLLKVDKNQLLYLDDKEWNDIMRSINDICGETYLSYGRNHTFRTTPSYLPYMSCHRPLYGHQRDDTEAHSARSS